MARYTGHMLDFLRGVKATPAKADPWEDERFTTRARALFYARMMFLGLGLLILAVPAWSGYFGLRSYGAFVGYFVMLLYSIANYLVINHRTAGRLVTYVTLCFDLTIAVFLIASPHSGGGLQSPLLASQLMFTTLFAILFPHPLAILPPLLALPITTRLDQLLDRSPSSVELLTLLWYSALNFIVIYVVVYLNEREVSAHREVLALQADLKELAVVEERDRIAREIHDGVGASLSSLIIQSEYLLRLATDDTLRKEITELRASAEEAIEELRLNLRMMRDDFDLAAALEDYVHLFCQRTQLPAQFQKGAIPDRFSPNVHLVLFRVLQESLSNVAKHAAASRVCVTLSYDGRNVALTIEDDGKGFDASVVPPGHFGLINMRGRAQRLGGELVLTSTLERGTSVLLSIPVTPPAR